MHYILAANSISVDQYLTTDNSISSVLLPYARTILRYLCQIHLLKFKTFSSIMTTYWLEAEPREYNSGFGNSQRPPQHMALPAPILVPWEGVEVERSMEELLDDWDRWKVAV